MYFAMSSYKLVGFEFFAFIFLLVFIYIVRVRLLWLGVRFSAVIMCMMMVV